MSDIREITEWLVGGAISGPNSEDVLAQLCERLVESGIPLWRVAVFVTTLHPDVMGRRFLWQADTGVTTSNALFTILTPTTFKKPVHHRLCDAQTAAPAHRRPRLSGRLRHSAGPS